MARASKNGNKGRAQNVSSESRRASSDKQQFPIHEKTINQEEWWNLNLPYATMTRINRG